MLQNSASAALIDTQDDERLGLGRVERELDEIFGGLGRRQPKAAVRREHGEVVALCAQRIREHVCERRGGVFEKLVVRSRGFVQLRAARGSGAAALIDGGADSFS